VSAVGCREIVLASPAVSSEALDALALPVSVAVEFTNLLRHFSIIPLNPTNGKLIRLKRERRPLSAGRHFDNMSFTGDE
jgi:hypothetical protein